MLQTAGNLASLLQRYRPYWKRAWGNRQEVCRPRVGTIRLAVY